MAVLESPSGGKYETSSPREITRLCGHGYKVVDEPEPKPEPDKAKVEARKIEPPKPNGA